MAPKAWDRLKVERVGGWVELDFMVFLSCVTVVDAGTDEWRTIKERLIESGVEAEEVRLLCNHLANPRNQNAGQELRKLAAQMRLIFWPERRIICITWFVNTINH